jgi:hypothetical protein
VDVERVQPIGGRWSVLEVDRAGPGDAVVTEN